MSTHKPPRPAPGEPYLPGDELPALRAVERSPESGWAEFEALRAGGTYDAPTEPMTLPGSLATAPRAAAQAAGGLAETLQVARAGNRVCPLPVHWARLYQLLLAAAARSGTQPPQPPVGLADWSTTAALAKRMFLRDHLEWAEAHGVLPAVHAFLAALPEAHWQHMGD